MIGQFGLPTFFVTFTYVERLWDPLIRALHTLHASRLNLLNKIKDLQFIHIAKLIQIWLVTFARYYDHKTSSFSKLITKDHLIFGYIFNFFSSLNSQIMGVNMTMDFYG
jgi:hypothetical protein